LEEPEAAVGQLDVFPDLLQGSRINAGGAGNFQVI